MRGTGSHDIHIDGVFVPAERAVPRNDLYQGPTPRPGVAYPQPLFPYLAAPTLAAVALGIARDAIDSFVELAKGKVQYMGSMPMAEHHTVHERVGRAEALLRSGRAFLYETARDVMRMLGDGADLEAVAAVARLAGAQAAESAAKAADLMFDTGGGSAIYTGAGLSAASVTSTSSPPRHGEPDTLRDGRPVLPRARAAVPPLTASTEGQSGA